MQRPRPLSQRELDATLLHRQGLDARWRCSPAEAVRRLVLLQAQWSPAPYLALLARLEGFEVTGLERALRRGAVVKSSLLRGTLHLVHAELMPAVAGAYHPHATRRLRGGRNREHDLGEELVAELRAFLAEPRTTDEVRTRVAELTPAEAPGGPLDVARALVPHVHALPSGSYARHGKFALRAWAGGVEAEPRATAVLARAFLAAYGPATREDLAAFSGLGLGALDAGLAELEPLRRRTDADGRELLDLPRAPVRAGDDPLPTRLLGPFDHVLLAHRPMRLGTAADRERVFAAANGVWHPALLVDGRVAGTWSHAVEGDAATLVVAPFAGGATPVDLEAEALRVLAVLAPDATRREVRWEPAG